MTDNTKQFVTDYINYLVLFEPDSIEIREKIKKDFLRLPGVRNVIILPEEPLDNITIICDDERKINWNIRTSLTVKEL